MRSLYFGSVFSLAMYHPTQISFHLILSLSDMFCYFIPEYIYCLSVWFPNFSVFFFLQLVRTVFLVSPNYMIFTKSQFLAYHENAKNQMIHKFIQEAFTLIFIFTYWFLFTQLSWGKPSLSSSSANAMRCFVLNKKRKK